jgi:hypothetical protein
MILLNFSHPLTPNHLARIAELTGEVPEVIEAPTQLDHEQPFAKHMRGWSPTGGLIKRKPWVRTW